MQADIYFIKVLTCLVPDLATISGLCPCKCTVKSNSVRRSAITQPSAQPGSRGLFIKQEYTPAVRCECGKANKTHPWMYSERLEARRGGLFCRRRRRDERDGRRRERCEFESVLARGGRHRDASMQEKNDRKGGRECELPSVCPPRIKLRVGPEWQLRLQLQLPDIARWCGPLTIKMHDWIV